MRTRPGESWLDAALAVLLVAGGAALGAALFGLAGGAAGAVLGGAVARFLSVLRKRRWQRRRALLRQPFPDAWRRLLQEGYEHYQRLPDAERARFEDDLRLFLAEKRITGVGVDATDELKLLVAASAVTLSLGWPDYEWDQLTEVLLYPQAFDRDYTFDQGELAGQAHAWGTVILSAPALRESFEDPWDAYHVGLHEFAHLLDLAQAHFDGIPEGLSTARMREWVELVAKERQRLRSGRSVIDPYGEESPPEFLAVAVEAFFEVPQALRLRHREVYAILGEYFRQDPAAWDDARGLVL